ncbi:MAG: hypothetical protein ACJ72N_25130 [Labedaea sp.]
MGRRIGGAGGGSDKGGVSGAAVVVAVAGVLAVGGAGFAGLEGATVSSGGAAESLTGPNLAVRKAEGQKSARKGEAKQAWQKMGMRELKKTVKQDISCLAHSHGKVREFFLRTPCTSLDRILLAVGDGQGNTMLVSVVWVGFRTKTQAADFKRVEDVPGSGDITPLGASLLTMTEIRFTGNHYKPRLDGKTLVIAETETATGHFGEDVLDAVADVAVYLPDVERAKR